MGTPTVPFKVMAEGYRIDSGRDQPIRAIVPYLVAWDDAFTFHDEVLGYPSAASIGPINQTEPYRFPPSTKLVATAASIEPCGVDGITGPMLGLSPGEFWTHAKITVVFETPTFSLSSGGAEDPNNLNQLDPANPITYCEMQIRQSGRAETMEGKGFEFDSTLFRVRGKVTKIQRESQLVLTFPRVPFLPWQKIQSYIGKVNDRTVLQCARGRLLFEGTDTQFSSTSQGIIGQQVQLTFAYQDHEWNSLWNPKASPPAYELVHRLTDTNQSIYQYANFADLFL